MNNAPRPQLSLAGMTRPSIATTLAQSEKIGSMRKEKGRAETSRKQAELDLLKAITPKAETDERMEEDAAPRTI